MTAAASGDRPLDLTVAICTWNRAPLLRRTLESIAAVDVPTGHTWELLVVDNASTDDTPRTLAAFRDRLPLRVVHEPRPGVSNARNTAVDAARGEVIVWTDDDVLVDRAWLRAYDEAITAHPDAVFFGGPIVPRFEGRPPAHIAAALRHAPYAYAQLDHGSQPGPLLPKPRRWAFTANMAIRRAAQRQLPYDAALGRQKGVLIGGEDTTLIREIWNGGGHGWWVPAARVEHIIPPERQTVAFLRRYFQGKGAQNALRAEPSVRLFGVPRWALRQAVVSEARYWIHRMTRPPEVWIDDLQRAATAWGFLQQARRAAHAAGDAR